VINIKQKYNFKYICGKCKRKSFRSIGGWRIECYCGGYFYCPSDPWKEEKSSDAKTLKEYRESRKWSQELMAAELGIEQGTLSKIERCILEVPPHVKEWLDKVRQ
jgi:DNA-binding XRE family transcriptional regulator